MAITEKAWLVKKRDGTKGLTLNVTCMRLWMCAAALL